ncbi:hypothetical protein LWP59_25250 [Amycolatopsis acidiphila]|uniref:hypothetical protein n=1 Tax=Amycolatopsis acidiphila TaxID=715473 RepID=UPI001F3D88CF|nr:hypothetical protein [Amycolatopsis acidiphila]UIJ64211.1 hypothetical protein LWP59_25250 [Amycolatopsis acidiphila]
MANFYGVSAQSAPVYLIVFAVGNLLGPLTIGHLFDTVGRRRMISSTHLMSGALLGLTAFLFYAGALNALTQTIAWCVIFYFASAGASSAYLTVSEILPIEVRAKAIAVFFAIAQCFGALGPGRLRRADRRRRAPGGSVHRLPVRRIRDGGRRSHRPGSRRCCRGQVTGGHRHPAVRHRPAATASRLTVWSHSPALATGMAGNR